MLPIQAMRVRTASGGGGGGGGGSAHAYWRVRVTKARGGSSFSISIGEIAMRSASSHADLCTGGTAISSADFGFNFPASKAFDNDANSRWASPVGAPHWVGYQFASPVEITEVAIASPGDPVPNECPEDFTIEWSDDGSTWTVAHTVTGEPAWPVRQTRLYSFGTVATPGAHRYWRLFVTANDGSGLYMGCSEFMLRDAGGIDRSTGTSAGAAASSQINSSNSADRAFDKDTTTTGWLSSSASVGQWLRWDFEASGSYGTPVEVKSVDIYGSWNAVDASPREFEIQYSDDATSWTTAASFLGESGWTASELRSFDVY